MRRRNRAVCRVATADLPTRHGRFTVHGYRDDRGLEHLVLQHGADRPHPLVRLHSECLTGDALGSLRCDCGAQLEAAARAVTENGGGLIVYLRGHEGRGIGLVNKIRAYALQDRGLDTVDANLALGLPADARDYRVATAILRDLGIGEVRLLTHNPAKVAALEAAGIRVSERVEMCVPPTPESAHYLGTKQERMGHHAQPPGTWRTHLSPPASS